MGLNETLKSGVATAFTALKDLAEVVTYKYYASGSPAAYNPAVPSSKPAPDSNKTIQQAIYLKYKRSETMTFKGGVPVPVEIQPNDRKVLIKAVEFGALTPKLHDQILRGDGDTFNIVKIERHPENRPALYIFQVRKP